jgi:hypothetical protein
MKILFVIVSALTGLFAGILYGAWSLPQGSGLAGPAIVLFNGAVGGIIALIISLFLVKRIDLKLLKIITIILIVLNLIPIGWIIYRLQIDQPEPRQEIPPREITTPVSFQKVILPANEQEIMGMGMAKPDFFNKKTLYFYSSHQAEKSLAESLPIDSLIFKITDHNYDISYAPPWFYPEHLKMDYEILYLKVLTISHDGIEVEVNKKTGLSKWISRSNIKILLWPEFFLSVFSVENLDPVNNLLRIKPLEHSSPLQQDQFSFLAPVLIKENWMKVRMMDDDLNIKGEAWLQWCKDGKLLISYSLLS